MTPPVLLEAIAGQNCTSFSSDLMQNLKAALGRHRAQANAWVTTQNLLVCLPSPEDAEGVCELLDEVAQSHPSRTVVVAFDPQSEGPVQGAATTICSQEHPGRVCSERISLVVPGDPERIPSLALPLLIPGVITFLWWRGEPPFGSNVLERLVEASDRVMFDSGRFHLNSGMKRLQKLMLDPYHAEQAFTDLAWGRVTTVREAVAALFDGPLGPERLKKISKVDIVSPGARPCTESLLLSGWLASRLGWTLTQPLHSRGKSYLGVYESQRGSVELRIHPGPADSSVNISLDEDRVETSMLRGCGLLQREFDLVDRDQVYEAALDATLYLAGEKEG